MYIPCMPEYELILDRDDFMNNLRFEMVRKLLPWIYGFGGALVLGFAILPSLPIESNRVKFSLEKKLK